MNPQNDTDTKPVEAGTPVQPHGANAAQGTPATGAENDVVALLKKAEDEALELKDAYLRARAEIENIRKQAQNDVSKAYRYAIEKFAQDLLDVKDSLESALKDESGSVDALRSGVELTLKQLNAAFEKAQIKEIAAQDAKFDPNHHQAMTMVESDRPANSVVSVFQKGYLLNDRVLRPALVAVAKAKDGAG